MRKSALLRRMWARGPASPPALACCCETRSLNGSRDELRTDHKRQRMDSRVPPSTADLSDWTPYVEMTDALSDGSLASPRPYVARDLGAPPAHGRSYENSETLSTSESTAKETPGSAELVRSDFVSSNERHFEDRVSACEPSVDNDDRNVLSSERLVCDTSAPYEVLEIMVSESASSTPADAGDRPCIVSRTRAPLEPLPHKAMWNMNIDEYVSNVLMESLNSLTDRLECMNASVGADRKLSVVKKEIKVRLQNVAVNTIVHLSPTSNNQIIFGNEELCDEALGDKEVCNDEHRNGETCQGARDECNNPCALMLRHASEEDNNNGSPATSPTPRTDAFDAVIQHNNVNRAVLQQIQKLFHDELRHEVSEMSLRHDVGTVSHIEISNVDTFLSGGAGADSISVLTRNATGAHLGGIRAGNYFRDLDNAALVPRCSALPHTASMEVNTSEEDTQMDALGSDAASLVDSLDDPDSPRSALLRRSLAAGPRRPELVRSAVDVLDLLPEDVRCDSASRDGGEAFFVRIRDDTTPDGERARVAEYMPERIRQKLHRRHRKRELRMECARRSKVRQLKEELERRRHDEQARARRELECECAAVVNLLLDEVIAKVAQDEYRSMRIKRKSDTKMNKVRSQENLNRGNGKRDPETHRDREPSKNGKHDSRRRRSDDSDERTRRSEKHQIRGKLLARPAIATAERGPHRIYQKSEIREGDKCIEILEILEYSHAPRSSPETTPTDESTDRARGRRSRIPVPVCERVLSARQEHMRLTGGDGRGEPPPLADLLLRALAPLPCPPLSEPRSRSNSLLFKHVFDVIPEERASLSFDSSADAEETEGTRRASAPNLIEAAAVSAPPAPALAPAPAPMESKCCVVTRSAGTSPPAEVRRLRSQTTMTSPSNKSAATSPWRAPPASPPCFSPSREGIVCALRPKLHRTTASLAVD